jgi:uncharacterized membrane protein YeiH
MQAVVVSTTFTAALNLIGVFVFAISGALLAIRKDYDIVGMTVLAEITAIGGGVVRDLILGVVPPSSFTDHISFLLPIVAVVLLFLVYRYIIQTQNHTQSQSTIAQRSMNQLRDTLTHRAKNEIQTTVLIFDAAGLALFSVVGATKALAYGLGPIESITLGALTAVGGGIMRDVLAGDQPTVLRAHSELYVIPAVLGSAIVVAVQYLHLTAVGSVAASIAVVVVFVLRMAALRYGWTAPQAKRLDEKPDSTSKGS